MRSKAEEFIRARLPKRQYGDDYRIVEEVLDSRLIRDIDGGTESLLDEIEPFT